MDWQYTLVRLYVLVCERFEAGLCVHAQRMSNNQHPRISDEELLTIYLFGIMRGHFQLRAIHRYTQDHLKAWFPRLPAYQTFVYRLSRLPYLFMMLSEELLHLINSECVDTQTGLVDSFPVLMATGKRSRHARVAPDLADKGRCPSKNFFFYGVKVHLLGVRRPGAVPIPVSIGLYPASANDLTAIRPVLTHLRNCRLFADKVYNDQPLKEQLESEQHVSLYTPCKRKKGQPFLRSDQLYYSQIVGRARQPIESLFNWIIEKTGINCASKVRSSDGLLVHVFGKMAAAMIMLVFNY